MYDDNFWGYTSALLNVLSYKQYTVRQHIYPVVDDLLIHSRTQSDQPSTHFMS